MTHTLYGKEARGNPRASEQRPQGDSNPCFQDENLTS